MAKSKLTGKDIMVFTAFVVLILIALPMAYLFTFYTGHSGTHTAGTIVDNKYYYGIAGKGIYEYTPGGESKRIIKSKDINAVYAINQDGVYQRDGKMIYFYDFETGENRLFFDAGSSDCSHISFDCMTDGNLNIRLHSKEADTTSQMIVETKSGNILLPQTEAVPNADCHWLVYTNLNIGNRKITKNIYSTLMGEYAYLEENGKNILPEDTVTDNYSGHKSGDCLVFGLYTQDYAQQRGLLLLRADGNDETVDIPYHYQWAIYGNYAYSISNYQYSELQCIDINTGESWILNDETDITATEITTDGNHIYTRDYHAKDQSCWEIIKDETGKPVKAVLVTEKI